jgi:glycerol-3-phosphate acyltransferase PlsY
VNPAWILAGCALAAYVIGSVPFGVLVARARGVDIRTVGSGNIGATNVFRTVGKGAGIGVFVLDAAKGFCGAFVLPLLAGDILPGEYARAAAVLGGLMAVLGHNYSLFLRFKGGKGIATSAGALLGFAPLAVAIGLGVWLLLFLLGRYVSVASIGAALAIGVASWFLYLGPLPGGVLVPATLTALGLMAVWRHRSNIRRLANGTEHRFTFRRRKS